VLVFEECTFVIRKGFFFFSFLWWSAAQHENSLPLCQFRKPKDERFSAKYVTLFVVLLCGDEEGELVTPLTWNLNKINYVWIRKTN